MEELIVHTTGGSHTVEGPADKMARQLTEAIADWHRWNGVDINIEPDPTIELGRMTFVLGRIDAWEISDSDEKDTTSA